MKSVNECMERVVFHNNTDLSFKRPDGSKKALSFSKHLEYQFEVLPHNEKNMCHLKDWLDLSISYDIPRSWFKTVVKEEYQY